MFFQSKPRELFSSDDARWLFTTSSTSASGGAKARPSSAVAGDDREAPLLLPLRSGKGLLKAECAKSRIGEIIQFGPERTSVGEIARELDLDEEVVERLLPRNGKRCGWILADKGVIVTRPGYDALLRAIYSKSSQGPLWPAVFTKQHKISPWVFKKLVRESNEIIDAHGSSDQQGFVLRQANPNQEWFVSIGYRKKLEDALRSTLNRADRPVQLKPDMVPGYPPYELLQEAAEALVSQKCLDGQLVKKDNVIEFISAVYVAAKRDELREKVIDSKIKVITFSDLRDLYHIDGKSEKDIDEGLPSGHYTGIALNRLLIFLEDVAVATEWFEKQHDVHTQQIYDDGHTIILCPDHPSLKRQFFEKLVEDLEWKRLKLIDDHVISQEFRDRLDRTAVDEARLQAEQDWRKGKESGYRRAVVLNAEALHMEALDPKVLNQLLTDKIHSHAEQAYNAEIRQLGRQATIDFDQDWNDKVSIRFNLYDQGLGSVQDTKLSEDLSASLFDHVTDELVPSTLKRAASDGLVIGKTLQRRVDHLRTSVEELKTALSSPEEGLAELKETLNASPSEPTAAPNLDLEKTRHVEEMLSSMQKDGHDARLFLTLVLVLIAHDGPGVVYATGRYAPRLLKQLKGRVDAERFAWLKTVKDQAKSGSMTPEMRAEVQRFARTSWDESTYHVI